MSYPLWAPKPLADEHSKRTVADPTVIRIKTPDPETTIAIAAKIRGNELSNEESEQLRRKLYRVPSGLPDEEGTDLIKKLITDDRMRNVWKSLAKQFKEEHEAVQFFRACENGITGWRGDPKLTPSEQRALYKEILDAADKLKQLLDRASRFDYYSISSLANELFGEEIQSISNASSEGHLAKGYLFGVMPEINDVLDDIGKKAKQYGDEMPLVKKANSVNAEVIYFVRYLSDYLKQTYKRPLHDVVATTTSVIFGTENVDTDYVRKIVIR